MLLGVVTDGVFVTAKNIDRITTDTHARARNQAFVDRYFPTEDPIGKQMKLGARPASPNPWMTIVGVVADARTESLADAAIPQIYRCAYQRAAKDLAIFLRGQLEPAQISAQVREQVQAIDHAEWRREVMMQEELFMKLYAHLPKELIFQRELLVARL